MSKRRKFETPRCLACLYSTGLGMKRIRSVTGFDIAVISRALNRMGCITPEESARRKSAQIERRKQAALNKPKPVKVKKVLVRRSYEQRKAIWRAMHYPKHAENKERGRLAAARRYKSARESVSVPEWIIKSRLRTRIYKKLKCAGAERRESSLKLVGCSTKFLRAYLETRFKDGMGWDNYGQWEIDHIIPCSSFDLTKISEQRKCFHFSNLQPLWKFENRAKAARKPEQMEFVA